MAAGPRRTQAERTAATRRGLLDATLDALIDVGFKGATTIEIARRAGVSPGALQGHFPTKTELLTAAVEYSLNRRIEEFETLIAGLGPTVDRLDQAVDLLWSMFRGPTFIAWQELWVAARTDPDLAGAVIATDRKFLEACTGVYTEAFAAEDPAAAEPRPHVGLQMLFALMNGLAAVGSIGDYRPLATDDILAAFKALLPSLIEPPTTEPPTTEPEEQR